MTVADHEAKHVQFLKGALKSKAIKSPKFDFGDATSAAKFAATAQVLEDTGVSAYLGQVKNIHVPGTLAAAGTIATVEARHASWIRFINGVSGAPCRIRQAEVRGRDPQGRRRDGLHQVASAQSRTRLERGPNRAPFCVLGQSLQSDVARLEGGHALQLLDAGDDLRAGQPGDALGAELLDVVGGDRGAVRHRELQHLGRGVAAVRGDAADEAAGEADRPRRSGRRRTRPG